MKKNVSQFAFCLLVTVCALLMVFCTQPKGDDEEGTGNSGSSQNEKLYGNWVGSDSLSYEFNFNTDNSWKAAVLSGPKFSFTGSKLTLTTADKITISLTAVLLSDGNQIELKHCNPATWGMFFEGSFDVESLLTITAVPKDFYGVYISTSDHSFLEEFDLSNPIGSGTMTEQGAVSWARMPPNGTYTVLLLASSEYKKATGVALSRTMTTLAFSDFVTIPYSNDGDE